VHAEEGVDGGQLIPQPSHLAAHAVEPPELISHQLLNAAHKALRCRPPFSLGGYQSRLITIIVVGLPPYIGTKGMS
jgi:hypothetical protein